MTKLSERLNFTTTKADAPADSLTIETRRDINIYDTLCSYCSDHDIDLDKITDIDFDSAASIIRMYKEATVTNYDIFYFWIDPK